MTDGELAATLACVDGIERAIRRHLGTTAGQAWEQQRGQVASRHVIGLRRSLQNWQDTRARIAAQQVEETHGQAHEL